jgi:hypothetical protein
MLDLVGYLASAILAISLMTSNSLRFRWLNIAGNITFITYGVLIHAIPVMVANSILLVINIYQLIKLYSFKETFHLVPFEAGDKFIQEFLNFYKVDIKHYFPDFTVHQQSNCICFAVLRDLVISNVFVAHLQEDGYAIVEINYTVANYRDFKVGRFIFDKEKEYLTSQGIKHIVYENVHNKNHQNFIKVMGFAEQRFNGKTCWVKSL